MTIRTVAIVQPNAFPWLGFFDQMRQADVFVYYDDVEFSRKSRAQRAHVRGPDDQPAWITIPVAHGVGRQLICGTPLATTGCETHWTERIPAKLRAWYRGAPHLDTVLAGLTGTFNEPHETLADINIAVIGWMAAQMGIQTETMRSSFMGIPADLDTTERPLAVCKELGARRFLCGPTARRYIDEPVFTKAGVEIQWHDFAERHPVYTQHREPFIPFLSALDYLIEHGPGWLEEV